MPTARVSMQRKILIIDDHDDLATALDELFSHVGHQVRVLENYEEVKNLADVGNFDLIITDIDILPCEHLESTNGNGAFCLPEIGTNNLEASTKSFKLCASNFRGAGFNEEELKNIVATVLDYKIRFVDKRDVVRHLHEIIEFELPSTIALMHIVLEYLLKRVEKLGVVKSEQSNLYVALDEAFVNAVKHGNKYNADKLVRISASVSTKEARFTIEDEGEGFDVNKIPDPLDPENLFKTSGRGVLFIYNIMDEVVYNEKGNKLTMVKKGDITVE